MKVTNVTDYKKSRIITIEDSFGQTMNVIIGVKNLIFHSIADAKRHINDDDHFTYEPESNSNIVKAFYNFAKERYEIDGGLPQIKYNPKFDN